MVLNMPRKKIAILGGGVSAMTAAFELTRRDDWKQEYEITVYQDGFRLGGKGASGRNPAREERIEEHGLHILLGFYENAFRMLRACYDELGRTPGKPLATWRDAFEEHDLIVLEEKVDGHWLPWPVAFPRNGSLPGEGGELPTPWDYIQMIVEWMWGLLDGAGLLEGSAEDAMAAACTWLADEAGELERDLVALEHRSPLSDLFHLVERAVGHVTEPEHATTTRALAHVRAHLARMPADQGRGQHLALSVLLGRFLKQTQQRRAAEGCVSDDIRRALLLLELGAATAGGMLMDGMVGEHVDWFAHDAEDYRTWLVRHGASREAAWSTPVRALYDIGFSWPYSVGAGTMIHGAMRMLFTYKGAIFWEMQAGMGDTISAPSTRCSNGAACASSSSTACSASSRPTTARVSRASRSGGRPTSKEACPTSPSSR